MSNPVTPIHSSNIEEQTCSAIVTQAQQDFFQIKINGTYYQAQKAFSCLIQPEVNDRVQVIFLESEVFITNILERLEHQQAANIQLPEKTNISSPGRILMQAKHISQETLNYELIAEQAELTTGLLRILSEQIYQFSEFNQIRTDQLLKQVSDFEQSITKELRMIVEDHWRVDSQSTHMLSEEDTIIDARTISLS